jgi:hypothetical protein
MAVQIEAAAGHDRALELMVGEGCLAELPVSRVAQLTPVAWMAANTETG